MSGDPNDSDPLANTEIATPASDLPPGLSATRAESAPVVPAVPDTIGRYRIDGVLGLGGMGTVYAARDPGLERRVALKILRGADTDAGRARLLREARAMARLSHPNVVTVYEVDTADGVDYIAMELIDGTTLAEWIAREHPAPRAIVAAFDAAGRGLAAAHAAGLTHRDFKPHNALRSKRGRVVVTDFGLARGALEGPGDRTALGRAKTDPPGSADADSLSSTLTATGAVVGTPAYMAPEQHALAPVGPAADQFAFAVGLWEALAGARPFPGDTVGAIRAAFARGPDPIGEAKIPRRLRAPLRRALAVDPAARFPTMEALLARLGPRRGRWSAIAAASGAIAVAAIAVVLTRGPAPAPIAGCGPPERELAGFRRSAPRTALAANPDGTRMLTWLDRFANDWVATQRGICAASADPELPRRLACSRATRVDLERAVAVLAQKSAEKLARADPVSLISDPRSCAAKPRAPERVVIDDPRAVAVLAAFGDAAKLEAIVDPGAGAPCLRAWWLLARVARDPTADELRDDLRDATDRCGDDRLAAIVLVAGSGFDISFMTDPTAGRRFATAMERAGGDRLIAPAVDTIIGTADKLRGDLDGSIDRLATGADRALALGSAPAAAAIVSLAARALHDRGGPGDDERAERMLRATLALGPSDLALFRRVFFDVLVGRGNTREAIDLAAALPDEDNGVIPDDAIGVRGRVVDRSGQPIAGARVAGGKKLTALAEQLDPLARPARVAITGADGRFALEALAPDSIVMAEHGDQRSVPVAAVPELELVVAPTSSVTGHVVDDRPPGHRVDIAIRPVGGPADRVTFLATVDRDGTWRASRVLPGRAEVVATSGPMGSQVERIPITVGGDGAVPLEIRIPATAVRVHVVVRSEVATGLAWAQVYVDRGPIAARSLAALPPSAQAGAKRFALPPMGSTPPALAGLLLPGDVLAHMPAVEPGTISVCAAGFDEGIMAPRLRDRIDNHPDAVAIACTTSAIDRADQVVVVEVPPQPRLPEP